MNNRLINTKVAGGGGGCTDIVDNYNPFGGGGVALYQLNGDATDVSGNYNGAWSGTETYSTGVFGQASVFNGSSYIQASAGYPSTLGNITVSGWFNFSNTNNGWVGDNSGSLFSLGQSTTNVAGNNLCIRLAENSTTFNLQSFNNDSSITMNTASPSIGTWFHIALTYEISTNKFKVYLNGAYQGESAALTYNFQTTAFRIGSGVQGGGTFHFQGLSDQVRIFNTALTPLEVEALYTEELCICDGTVDTLDILGDTSCIATYQLDGNANDLSGNYSGTPTDVSYGVGEFDLAGVFNGSSSRISLPNSAFNTLTSYTISSWIYLTSTADFQTIFTNYDIVSSSSRGVGFRYRQSASNIEVFNLLSNTSTFVYSINSIPQNTWTNLTVTNTQSEIKIYINGSFDSSHSTSGFNSYSDSSTDIGALTSRIGEQEQYFSGSIDQVRIFNKALSAGEVTTLYNESACTKAACTGTTNTLDILGDSSCIAAYPLDGSPADLSGNYNGVQGGNVTYPQGEFDLAAAFGGSGKGIDLPSNTPVSGQINCSISLWFNVLSNSKKETLIRFANNDEVLLRINTNGTLDLIGVRQSDTTYISYTTAGSYNNGVWHHLVMTRESGSIKFYINNVLDNTLSWNNTFITAANETAIGYDGFASASVLSGSIDQVRIFNKALSLAEVGILYNNETPCN